MTVVECKFDSGRRELTVWVNGEVEGVHPLHGLLQMERDERLGAHLKVGFVGSKPAAHPPAKDVVTLILRLWGADRMLLFEGKRAQREDSTPADAVMFSVLLTNEGRVTGRPRMLLCTRPHATRREPGGGRRPQPVRRSHHQRRW